MSTSNFAKYLNEQGSLSSFSVRLLKSIAEFEPTISDDALNLIAMLFACNEQGDTRVLLNETYIFNTCCRKFGADATIMAYATSAAKAINSIGKYRNIVGSVDLSSFPLIIADNALYVQKYYLAKQVIVQKMHELFKAPASEDNLEQKIQETIEQITPPPHDRQAEAIVRGENQNLIVTGGPGTGKTTVVFHILARLLSKKGTSLKIHLAAPSGKAASRMEESIKNSLEQTTCSNSIKTVLQELKGETIHRLLRYRPNTNNFLYNEQNTFPEGEVFVIDEASMIDIEMFANLLSAIPSNSHVFLLGDENQLPSVDAGAVLGDLLGSIGHESVVRLTKSFRSIQAIKELADKVNEAQNLNCPNFGLQWNSKSDFLDLLPTDMKGDNNGVDKVFAMLAPGNKGDLTKVIAHIVKTEYEPFEKQIKELIECASTYFSQGSVSKYIQEANNEELFKKAAMAWKVTKHTKVLCASRQGRHGTAFFNEEFAKLFPIARPLMINTNLYPYSLYNGDTGLAFNLRINGKRYSYVMFERANAFEFFETNALNEGTYETSFAMTIHKSQGSEYENVIMVLPENKESPLLSKQILYTGITRAKYHCVVISDEDHFRTGACRKEPRETGIEL